MGTRHTEWVPNDTMGSRQETAVLLVGSAREFGISQQDIASTHGGFYITKELADLVFTDEEPGDSQDEVSGNDEPPAETTKKSSRKKKTSGNRAEKNTSQEGE